MTTSSISPRNNVLSQPRRLSGFSVLVAATLVLSACASKPDRRGPPQERGSADHPARTSGTFLKPVSALFIGMDSNNDKAVSRSELASGIQSKWSGFSQRPTAISFSDWSLKNLGSTDAMPTFMSFDRDFNGVLTEAEFSDQLEIEFDRLDKNKDGQLVRSEMIVAFAAPQGQRSRQGGQSGRPERGQGGRGGGRPSR